MKGGQVTEFFDGVKLLLSGVKRYARNPRLVMLGLVPALMSLLLFGALFVLLIYFIGDITSAATWFARDWSDGLRSAVEIAAGVAIVAVTGLLMMLTYTAVTLAVGDPFYEAIAESVEDEWGGVPDEVELPWYRGIVRSLLDSVRLLLRSAMFLIPLALAGFIPLVGQTVIPVLGAFVGGWFMAMQLVGVAFYRRGMGLAQRRQLLRQHRPTALGLGVAVFCCFLIPFGAVLIMPAAVIAGTLLARHVLGLPLDKPAT